MKQLQSFFRSTKILVEFSPVSFWYTSPRLEQHNLERQHISLNAVLTALNGNGRKESHWRMGLWLLQTTPQLTDAGFSFGENALGSWCHVLGKEVIMYLYISMLIVIHVLYHDSCMINFDYT